MRAVTFESPGSYEYLERLNVCNVYSVDTKFDLNQLDIRTYVTLPNFVNTSNTHVGKVYRVLLLKGEDDEYASGMDEFINRLILTIPTIYLRMKLKNVYEEKVKDRLNEYVFYLNGIKALFANGYNL